MIIENLTKLYPTGYLSKRKAKNNFLSLPIEEQYFIIEKAILEPKECQLLETLFLSSKPTLTENQHPWYGYLFQEKALEFDGLFRIFQIQLTYSTDFLKTEWENSIKEMFPKQVDFFFTSDSDCLLIEKFSKSHYNFDELQGIFLTLDTDFDVKSTVFIGNFFASTQPIPQLFKEEQQIFTEEAPRNPGKKVFTLTDVALHYFTKEAMNNSQIVQNFWRSLSIDTDMQPIINALWKNQGNISSAAKELFMHRNTLHYRLEKFYEQTGLSLKKMDDLIFCYLLLSK